MNKKIFFCCLAFIGALTASAGFVPKSFLPAENTEVTSLSKITALWPVEWFEDIKSGVCGRVENEAGESVATLTCEENYSYEDPACDFELSGPVNVPGTYTVFVDADVVFNEDEEGNDAFEIKYEVVSAAQASLKLLSAVPGNNSVLPSLTKIETEWSAKVAAIDSEIVCSVFDSEGEIVCEVIPSKGVFSSDPVVLTLSKTIDKEGTYKVVIHAGVFETEDGVKSEEVELNYTVEPSVAVIMEPLSIDPEDGSTLESLEEIIINWDAEFDFDFFAREVGKVVDEYGITVATLDCEADIMDETATVLYLSQAVEENGTYKVIINDGAIVAANGAKNELLELSYILDNKSGAESISASGNISVFERTLLCSGFDKVKVCDLSGNTIIEQTGSTQVLLNPGVFIVQTVGKAGSASYKVMIR